MSRLGNVARVWKTAYEEVRADEADLDRQMRFWERDRPENNSLDSFYRTYVWAVYFTGMKVSVIEAKSEEIESALRDFDIEAIATEPDAVREDTLAVFGHRQKADAAISTAIRLNQNPEEWERLKVLPLAEALDELLTYPYIGRHNRYHIARNLGWDVAMTGGFTGALAENLGTTPETLMGALSKASGKRLNTTDIVMGMWSRLHDSEEDAIQRTRVLLGLSSRFLRIAPLAGR